MKAHTDSDYVKKMKKRTPATPKKGRTRKDLEAERLRSNELLVADIKVMRMQALDQVFLNAVLDKAFKKACADIDDPNKPAQYYLDIAIEEIKNGEKNATHEKK